MTRFLLPAVRSYTLAPLSNAGPPPRHVDTILTAAAPSFTFQFEDSVAYKGLRD